MKLLYFWDKGLNWYEGKLSEKIIQSAMSVTTWKGKEDDKWRLIFYEFSLVCYFVNNYQPMFLFLMPWKPVVFMESRKKAWTQYGQIECFFRNKVEVSLLKFPIF